MPNGFSTDIWTTREKASPARVKGKKISLISYRRGGEIHSTTRGFLQAGAFDNAVNIRRMSSASIYSCWECAVLIGQHQGHYFERIERRHKESSYHVAYFPTLFFAATAIPGELYVTSFTMTHCVPSILNRELLRCVIFWGKFPSDLGAAFYGFILN